MSLIPWCFDFLYSSNSWRRQSPREEGALPTQLAGPQHEAPGTCMTLIINFSFMCSLRILMFVLWH